MGNSASEGGHGYETSYSSYGSYGYDHMEEAKYSGGVPPKDWNSTFGPWLVQWYRDHDVTPLTPFGYYACAIYMFVLGIPAIFGNALTLYMFARNPEARAKPMNILILNTAISDFGVGVLGYPFEMWSFFKMYFNWSDTFCTIQGASHFWFALVDMTSLIVFSIYRYLIVCHDCGSTLSAGFTVKLCMVIWVYASCWISLPLMGINAYEIEIFGTVCTIDWDTSTKTGHMFIYCLIAFGFCVPVSTMIFCYCRVIAKTNELAAATRGVSVSKTDLGVASEANEIIAEAKVTKISIIMVVTYLMSWSPFAIISTLVMNYENVPVEVKLIPHMAAKISCGINPIIFFATNKVFRDTFLATFIKGHKISSGIADANRFTIDKSKDGVFLGEQDVVMKKAKTSMF